jgi:hypothetical protein
MMPPRRIPVKAVLLAFLASLALAAAAPAGAKPLFTPPVAITGTVVATCVIQNVSAKARTVTATMHDSSGGVIETYTNSVAPGQVLTFVSATMDFGVYCGFDGLTKGVRGFVNVFDGTVITILPTLK